MNAVEVVDAVGAGLDEALAAQDWTRAQSCVEQLTSVVVRAVAAHDGERAHAVADLAAAAAARLSMKADVSARPSPTSLVWLLRSVAAVAEAGRQGLPLTGDGHTRDLIVARLKAVDAVGATNSELATACGRSPETISRVLRQLRQEGQVEYQSVGRARRNWIAGARPARGLAVRSGEEDVAVVEEASGKTDIVTPAREIVDAERHEPLPVATSARELAGAF